MKKQLSGQTENSMLDISAEYDVQDIYWNYYKKSLGLKFKTELKSDGYGINKKNDVFMLAEFKKQKNFTNNRADLTKVLVQCTYTLRKFFLSNYKINVLFVADRDEFFILNPKLLAQYFSLDIDWNLAPSQAHFLKNELYHKIFDNQDINPIVYSLTSENLELSKEIILNLSKDGTIKTKITPQNFPISMENFKGILAPNYTLPTNRLANLWAQLIVNPDSNNLPGAKNLKFLNTISEGNVPIKSRESWENLWNHYEKNYTLEEKDALVASVDRIVEDLFRRKQGEFYTPDIWVNKAHEYISDVFPNWKQKLIVWDSCWGTGNLTRGYYFNNLVATTLHASDIETAKQSNYNNEADRRVFDFLNDPDDYYPPKIKKAIEEKKEILFLINPPYATSNTAGNNSEDKEGVSQTKINKKMKEDGGWGKSVQQLYAQFIYRIMSIPTKTHLCIFSKPTFLTGDAFEDFRKKFNNKFEFKKGFVMNSDEFADVKSWPLTFSIFEDISNY